MEKTDLVRFSNNQAIYTNTHFDGYLAFLPEPAQGDGHPSQTDTALTSITPHLSYRSFYGKEFCWFEFKNSRLSTNLRLQITARENHLWLLINMRTGIFVNLGNVCLVPQDMLLCYHTLVPHHDIDLRADSNWFLLLGIDGRIIDDLTEEYTQLQELFITTAENLPYRTIGTVNVQVRLKRIMEALHQIKFRPFSTYYHLANWNMRFFQSVFQQMQAQSIEKTDYEIDLYYKAIAYIRENYCDDRINIETIANALHVSESTLKRAFQGKSFSVAEQITEFRLQKARELIRSTNQPISRIAYTLNFACPKHFKRLFIKRFLISPLEYRDSINLKRLF